MPNARKHSLSQSVSRYRGHLSPTNLNFFGQVIHKVKKNKIEIAFRPKLLENYQPKKKEMAKKGKQKKSWLKYTR